MEYYLTLVNKSIESIQAELMFNQRQYDTLVMSDLNLENDFNKIIATIKCIPPQFRCLDISNMALNLRPQKQLEELFSAIPLTLKELDLSLNDLHAVNIPASLLPSELEKLNLSYNGYEVDSPSLIQLIPQLHKNLQTLEFRGNNLEDANESSFELLLKRFNPALKNLILTYYTITPGQFDRKDTHEFLSMVHVFNAAQIMAKHQGLFAIEAHKLARMIINHPDLTPQAPENFGL